MQQILVAEFDEENEQEDGGGDAALPEFSACSAPPGSHVLCIDLTTKEASHLFFDVLVGGGNKLVMYSSRYLHAFGIRQPLSRDSMIQRCWYENGMMSRSGQEDMSLRHVFTDEVRRTFA